MQKQCSIVSSWNGRWKQNSVVEIPIILENILSKRIVLKNPKKCLFECWCIFGRSNNYDYYFLFIGKWSFLSPYALIKSFELTETV